MKRLWLALACAAVLAGCGGGGTSGGGLDPTLSYFPRDPLAIGVLDTNLDDSQWREVDRLVERRTGKHVEQYLRAAVDAGTDFSWDDVRPLLGKELVVGGDRYSRHDVLLAWHVADGGKLHDLVDGSRLFRKAGESHGATLYRVQGAPVAIEDDVLLAATNDATIERALARHDGADHLTDAAFEAALGDTPQDRLVRFYGDASTVLARHPLDRLRALPWVEALRSYGGAFGFDGHEAAFDLVANTDASGLQDADLPFAPGRDTPPVLRREHEIVSANRNQSFTTAFLFRAAELAYPDARFVRDVHALEQRTGIDFVQEVLRQFDGPSASLVSLDGKTFAARSQVRDPQRVEREVRALAPDLPQLILGLRGLQSQGQALLFLLAPDAPITFRKGGVVVRAPARPGGLWRVSGLRGQGPPVLWFGVVGHQFVVGSNEALTRAVATMPSEQVAGARGAAVLRVHLAGLERQAAARLGFGGIGPLGDLVASVESSRERLHVHATLELP